MNPPAFLNQQRPHPMFPKHLANTTKRIDPLSNQPANFYNPPNIAKMQMEPLLIQHRLVNFDTSGNLKFNNIVPYIHDYGTVTSVGPWTINKQVIPKPGEFKNLILKRTIPIDTPWFYEPTRFVLTGAIFHGKGFRTYTTRGKQTTEAFLYIQKRAEACLNIEEFVKVSAQQVKEAMIRGGLEENLAYAQPLIDFSEDEYLKNVNSWSMEDIVYGLPLKVNTTWSFKGALDNEPKTFTVDELNHCIELGCFFDVVLRPQMWIVKSELDGQYRCGINFNMEHVDVRKPLTLEK